MPNLYLYLYLILYVQVCTQNKKVTSDNGTSAEDPNGAAMSIGSGDEGEESKIFIKPLFAVSRVKCLGMGVPV